MAIPLHYAIYSSTSDVLEYLVAQKNLEPSNEALIYYLADLKQMCNVSHLGIMINHIGVIIVYLLTRRIVIS